jgi:O-antigen ligase
MSRYPLFRFRATYAGQGSFSHPYHLVCALGVALGAGWLGLRAARERTRWLWIAGFPVIGAALGTSYSRSIALALPVAIVIGLVARRGTDGRALRITGALLAVAFVAGVYVGLDGWQFKADVTAHPTSFDSGRSQLAEAALDVIEAHPLLGVGPGSYVDDSVARGTPEPLPPHNWLLQVGAEEGVVAAAVVLALSLVMCARAVRAGPEATMALILLVPFWIGDAFPYTYPHGLALSALWLGMLHLELDEREEHEERGALVTAQAGSSPGSGAGRARRRLSAATASGPPSTDRR